MKFSRPLLLVVAFLGFLQIQCLLIPDDTEKGTRVANIRPSVRITAGASNSDTTGLSYKVLFRWNGVDVDGVVSLFQYAVDDTVTEGAWRDTTEYSARINFTAEVQDSLTGDSSRFTDWHTFYIRAIDNESAVSVPDHRFFNAVTIAPETTIEFPIITSATPQLQQTLIVRWDGDDLDSSDPEQKPVAWEYKLVPVENIITDSPEVIEASIIESDNLLLDTLRVGDKRRWIRVPFEESSLRLANLVPNSQLAFAVRAVDEAGAVEPGLEKNRNYIAFIVSGVPGTPEITIGLPAGDSHRFTAAAPDPWEIEVPANREIRFRWTGDASAYGSEFGNSNYGLDIPDPEDETLRDPNGIGGWIGWGAWREVASPIVFSNAEAGQRHHFWVKGRDISDSRDSELLCEVSIFVVPFTFEKLALIVDDSKSVPDVDHDAFMKLVMARRFLDFDEVDEFPLWGTPTEGSAPVGLSTLQLSYLAQYQHILWHTNRGVSGGPGLPLNQIKDDLGTYLSAGGRMFLVGDRISSHMVDGVFRYPKDPPPLEGDEGGDFETDNFIWTHMRVRNRIVSLETGANPAQLEASGLVGARSLHPAYPDIDLDYQKWDPWLVLDGNAFQSGISRWEAVQGFFRPIQRFAGMDSLYAPVTFDTTYTYGARHAGYDDAVLGWRYESTRQDTIDGTEQGRLVVIDFQPYYFDANAVQDMGTSSINWLMTGLDH
ncbi:MAG: hypothetical protein H6682_01270 [Candidatus Eisenbacteria bacterium]|nr:hypothetical protein [Candidatus Eisenbacteria bacterium]